MKKTLRCLKCEKPFLSKDPKTNRLCETCRRVNKRIRDITPKKDILPPP